jgi:hypothetical protein
MDAQNSGGDVLNIRAEKLMGRVFDTMNDIVLKKKRGASPLYIDADFQLIAEKINVETRKRKKMAASIRTLAGSCRFCRKLFIIASLLPVQPRSS